MDKEGFEEFKEQVFALVEADPNKKYYRLGQAVFNVLDNEQYGNLARIAQTSGIDCFYDDTKIDDFLRFCYELKLKCEYEKYFNKDIY